MPGFPNFFSPAKTDLGRGLQNIAAAMFPAGQTPDDLELKRMRAENQRRTAELHAAQTAELAAKRRAADEAALARTNAPGRIAESFGLPADASTAFIQGKPVAPIVANDDEGVPNIPSSAPRPTGMTPDIENVIRSTMRDLAVQGALSGRTNFEQFRQGQGYGQQNDIVGNARAGVQQPIQQIGEAYTATHGRPLYSDHNGRVLRNATGTLNESGGQAVANVGETNAKAGRERAHGSLYGAQTDRTRSLPISEPLVAVTDENGDTVYRPRSEASGLAPGVLPARAAPEKPPKAPSPVSEKAWDDTINSALGIVKKGGKTATGSAHDTDVSTRNAIKKAARQIRETEGVIDLGEAVQLAIERAGGTKRGAVPTGETSLFGNPKERPGTVLSKPPTGMAADGAPLPAKAKPAAGAQQLIDEANAAIKQGADPAKVKARLKQMGVTLKE